MVSFPHVSPPKPCAHPSLPPYVPHVPHISFFSILSPAQYWVSSTEAKSITAKKMTSKHQVYVVDYYVTKIISICQGRKSYDCKSVFLLYYPTCKMHLNLKDSTSRKQEELNVMTSYLYFCLNYQTCTLTASFWRIHRHDPVNRKIFGGKKIYDGHSESNASYLFPCKLQ